MTAIGTRLDLQRLLEEVAETENVYFQPPSNLKMALPCIKYSLDYQYKEFADNGAFTYNRRYQVIYITKDPDSPIPDRLFCMPMTAFERAYTADNLYHYIYRIYF